MKKENKKHPKKIYIIISIIIAILVIGIIITFGIFTFQKIEKTNMYKKSEDAIQRNSSTKVQGSQKVDKIEISNVEVLVENGETTLNAVAYNNTKTVLGNVDINIEMFTKSGKIYIIYGYIEEISPGGASSFKSILNKEIKDVQKVNFSKKESNN